MSPTSHLLCRPCHAAHVVPAVSPVSHCPCRTHRVARVARRPGHLLCVAGAARVPCVMRCLCHMCPCHLCRSARAPHVVPLVSNMLHTALVCYCQSEKKKRKKRKKKTKDATYCHCGSVVVVTLREGTFARRGEGYFSGAIIAKGKRGDLTARQLVRRSTHSQRFRD